MQPPLLFPLRCLIAFDDTDSRLGHCTTHLGYQVVSALLSEGCTFHRYPRLVRLNPNIPFKTRGNAAVTLDFESERPDHAFETAESLLHALSDVENGANSGAVFLKGGPDSRVFRPDVYKRQLYMSEDTTGMKQSRASHNRRGRLISTVIRHRLNQACSHLYCFPCGA